MNAPRIDGGAVLRFAPHARFRFDEVRQAWVVLAPERLLLPDEQAVEILRLIDGARDVDAIIDALAGRFDAPRNVIAIAGEMVKARTHLEAARRGALLALDLIESAVKEGSLLSSEQEREWFPRLREELHEIPDDESAFVELVLPTLDKTKTVLAEYGL